MYRLLRFCLFFLHLISFQPSIQAQTSDVHAFAIIDSTFDEQQLIGLNIRIQSRLGNIITVLAPDSTITDIKLIKGVKYLEIADNQNASRMKNDIERSLTKVDLVHDGLNNSLPRNYTGKGVIIGIVDIGFQCDHPNFYTPDSVRYRVTRYWRQSDNSSNKPDSFSYGSEYTDTTVIKTLNDLDGSHGTHVAGIAAGSGLTTPGLKYKGVAPDAELVFVSIKYANDTLNGSALGDYLVANPSIIDAYKYIFDYAQSVGKPAVINLSWGMHTGPHDGSSLFDLATEKLVGKGRILVGANGNEGDNPMHWHHKFNKDTVGTIMIENGRQFRQSEHVYADFWGSPNNHFSLKVQVIDTNKTLIVETPFISTATDTSISIKLFADSSEFKIHFKTIRSYLPNSKPNMSVSVDHPNQRKYAVLAYLTSDSSDVHGWNSGAARDWTSGSFRNILNKLDFTSSFISGDNISTMGENGGTSKVVISVGALAARSAYTNQYGKLINDSSYVIPPNAVKFSSQGPTIDGRIKPDISAPGYDVPSSVNNKQIAPWMEERTLLKTVFENDTQYWMASSGTSMAAPHVTGIVALMLQVDSDLDPENTLSILESTALTRPEMDQLPNNKYGYGQVDAYSAIIRTLQTSSINNSNKANGILVYPNPLNNILTLEGIDLGSSVVISDMQGRVILNMSRIESEKLNLNLEDLNAGIYIISYFSNGELFTYRLIKNQ